MRFAILGDIHGCFSNLKRIISQLRKCDAVFIVGDITGTLSYSLIIKSIIKNKKISREKYAELVYGEEREKFARFQIKTATKFIKIILKLNKPVFFTHGNSEVKEIRDYFINISKESNKIFYLGEDVISYKDWIVVGYGYCSPAKYREPFQTPGEKTENMIRADLSNLVEKIKLLVAAGKKKKIGIFHEPPNETTLDYITEKKIHGGSHLIKDHIKETNYNLVFAGHIHESQAFDRIEDTLLVNPGPLVNGEWAILDNEEVIFHKIKIPFSLKGLIYRSREKYK